MSKDIWLEPDAIQIRKDGIQLIANYATVEREVFIFTGISLYDANEIHMRGIGYGV